MLHIPKKRRFWCKNNFFIKILNKKPEKINSPPYSIALILLSIKFSFIFLYLTLLKLFLINLFLMIFFFFYTFDTIFLWTVHTSSSAASDTLSGFLLFYQEYND